MRTFKKMRGIRLTYTRQGLIYFICMNYMDMPEEVQKKILNLCIEVAGEDYNVLFEVLTTEKSVRNISLSTYVPEKRLYKMRKHFYESFF